MYIVDNATKITKMFGMFWSSKKMFYLCTRNSKECYKD